MTECLQLKKSNCMNCYKCIRNCPVKSIRFSAGQANISADECILCGQCFVVCPQNAKQIVDDTEKVSVLLASGSPVFASLAPSFIANYDGADISDMDAALKKLGFFAAEETAIGAEIVKKEYDEQLKDISRDIIISSCCHSVNLLIQKYFPSLLKYLSDILSPMQAHAEDIKRRYPDAKVVFIGPCVAKKDEANTYPGIVDAALTFENLSAMLKDSGVEIEKKGSSKKTRSRWFPTTGGILKSMECKNADYSYMAVDGADSCIAVLKDIERGGVHKCFIEMSICPGSCIGGPVMEKYHRSPVRDFSMVKNYAGKEDGGVSALNADKLKKEMQPLVLSQPQPSETEILDILKKMGKTCKEDELNCGSCGYNTCREKAVAVYRGKADLSMCLPFLKGKAESFSDIIMRNTVNGVLVLNEELEVQQINGAAMDIMNIRKESDVLGEPVVRILDPADFLQVAQTGRTINGKHVYLAEYKKYVEMSIIYDKEYRLLLCVMKDTTDEEASREQKDMVCKRTVETADKVVDKQMRVVQEITSLLGETVAETKIALTKLKESLKDE